MRRLLALLPLLLVACPPVDEDDSECAGPADCKEPDPAPCDGCAPLALELCIDGVCTARGDDAVDVSIANLLIDRDVDGVNGMRFAVLTSAPCADALALGDDVNALASGQKTLTGGDLHQDVFLGRVPEGNVTVVVLGTAEAAGAGDVLARGCVAALAGEPPALVVERIDLTP
jgi:hypothetical protein